jgi:hypothetical protein
MKSPQQSTSVLTLIELGTYTLSQMESNPSLPPEIGAGMAGSQNQLETSYAQALQARRARMAAVGGRDWKNATLDQKVRDFGHTLRAKALNDPRSPIYLTYFPNGTTDVVRRPAAEEIEFVSGILTKLEMETDDDLRDCIPVLTSAMASLEDAMRALSEAARAESNAYEVLEKTKQLWIETYRETYNKLRAYYRSKPRFAERYFNSRSASKRKNAPPEVLPAGAEPTMPQSGAGRAPTSEDESGAGAGAVNGRSESKLVDGLDAGGAQVSETEAGDTDIEEAA